MLNILFIILVIVVVYLSGNKSLQNDAIGHFMTLGKVFQVISLICLSVFSWKLTPIRIRKDNDYTWFPILEINKLFITIFLTRPIYKLLFSELPPELIGQEPWLYISVFCFLIVSLGIIPFFIVFLFYKKYNKKNKGIH